MINQFYFLIKMTIENLSFINFLFDNFLFLVIILIEIIIKIKLSVFTEIFICL